MEYSYDEVMSMLAKLSDEQMDSFLAYLKHLHEADTSTGAAAPKNPLHRRVNAAGRNTAHPG